MNKITVNVFRSSIGDCTNGGITSSADRLTLGLPGTDADLIVNVKNICGEKYVHCVPSKQFADKVWTMNGGNFVYTSDSNYKQITGVDYPISVHDRVE